MYFYTIPELKIKRCDAKGRVYCWSNALTKLCHENNFET